MTRSHLSRQPAVPSHDDLNAPSTNHAQPQQPIPTPEGTSLTPQQVLHLQKTHGNQFVRRMLAQRKTSQRGVPHIQRNVGLEIEVGAEWAGFRNTKEMITGEHRTLVTRPGFHLENELSGRLEFVMEDPGARNLGELLRITQGMADLAQELLEKSKKYELIPMSEISGGTKDLYIRRGYLFSGEFQATIGVHLSAIPKLFATVGTIGANVIGAPAVGNQVNALKKKTVGRMGGTSYHQISPEMEGLLTMILYYLFVGARAPNHPFPKGLTNIMARTDFGQMFKMTPEARYFADRKEEWVKLVCGAAGLDPDGRIFQQKFDPRNVPMDELYKGGNAVEVDITRRAWLENMTANLDILTQHGGGPPILKTMGSLKQKTDDLGVDGEMNRAVIVELRSIETEARPPDWVAKATEIGTYVDELNARNTDRSGSRAKVARAGSEANLYNTGFERQAGDEVNAMAYEAFFAEFKAQVEGLAQRAEARAELAADEREMTWGKRKGLPTAEELGIKIDQ